MIDDIFFHSLMWLFSLNTFVLVLVGIPTVVVTIVSMVYILRKWGSGYEF